MSDPFDYDAERKLFHATIPADNGHCDYVMQGWMTRARLAAERERSLLDLLADAQHAVCCYSCPEPREGEPDRHCDLCQRITAALGTREERA